MLATSGDQPSCSETRHSYHSTTGAAAQRFGALVSGARAQQAKQASRSDMDNHVPDSYIAGGSIEGRQSADDHGGCGGGSATGNGSFNQMAMLYAIFLTLFGLIFPLSSFVRAKPYSDWLLIGFYIILHSSAIAVLLFFMTWLMTRPSRKLFVENAAEHTGEVVRLQDTERLTPVSSAEGEVASREDRERRIKIGRFSVSESSHNLQDKAASQATRSNKQQEQQLPMQELKRSSAVTDKSQNSEQQTQQQRAATSPARPDDPLLSRINSTLIRNAKELGVHEIQAYSVLSLQESHSPSFFLRIACFLFGGLKVTHDVLHIVDTLTEVGNECLGGGKATIQLVQYTLSIVFTSLQTFFIFKYSKVSINICYRASVLGFMHLMATNMCVWFQAILLETSHNAAKHSVKASNAYASNLKKFDDSNASLGHEYGVSNGGHGAGNCSKEVFWRMAPYLFPFTIEYSLMAAFSCYVLYCNVGKFIHVIQTKGFNVGKKCLRNRKKTQTSFSASCYKSDKGFFLGALQMIVGVTSGIYFTVYINEEPDDLIVGKYIYLITDMVLLTFNLIISIVAYRQVQRLTLVHHMSTGPDAWLLGITLIGVLAYELFQLFGALAEQGLFLVLRLFHGATCIMQSLLQVFLVLDGEKRRSRTKEAIDAKPGREMIASLLLGNLALWVVYTLEVREINNLPNYNDAYILIAAQIFSYLCSPLIIFFRFHSACCFVDIWRHAYKGRRGSDGSFKQLEEAGCETSH